MASKTSTQSIASLGEAVLYDPVTDDLQALLLRLGVRFGKVQYTMADGVIVHVDVSQGQRRTAKRC